MKALNPIYASHKQYVPKKWFDYTPTELVASGKMAPPFIRFELEK
jgi:hypothetical protein